MCWWRDAGGEIEAGDAELDKIGILPGPLAPPAKNHPSSFIPHPIIAPPEASPELHFTGARLNFPGSWSSAQNSPCTCGC